MKDDKDLKFIFMNNIMDQVDYVSKVEGKVVKVAEMGGGQYIKFESGNTYSASLQKVTSKVVLD